MTNEELADLIRHRTDNLRDYMDLRLSETGDNLRRGFDAKLAVIQASFQGVQASLAAVNAALTSINNDVLDMRADLNRLRETINAHARALDGRS